MPTLHGTAYKSSITGFPYLFNRCIRPIARFNMYIRLTVRPRKLAKSTDVDIRWMISHDAVAPRIT